MFDIGVGKIGNYDQCCWQVLGEGQFRAVDGANPSIGIVGQLEKLREYKVEMVCSDELIHQAILVLKKSHPYEEVAYEYYKINTD